MYPLPMRTAILVSTAFLLRASQGIWQDPVKHDVQLLAVDTGVRLEVLDWGGPAIPHDR